MPARLRTGLRPGDYAINESGCWIWQLRTDRDGYGQVRANGVSWRAHRWSWTVAFGPIPEGLDVDHLCFVPSCINPTHLRLLTPTENSQNHRAAFKTHCTQGHEFTPENTLQAGRTDGRTYRRCRTCRATSSRVRSAARRARVGGVQ
jgi:hypothetical protein